MVTAATHWSHDFISVVEVLTALRSNGRSGDESLDEVTGVRIRNDEIAMLKEEPNKQMGSCWWFQMFLIFTP